MGEGVASVVFSLLDCALASPSSDKAFFFSIFFSLLSSCFFFNLSNFFFLLFFFEGLPSPLSFVAGLFCLVTLFSPASPTLLVSFSTFCFLELFSSPFTASLDPFFATL